ncbi:MAG: hypothetical protein R3C05_20760 [Pirellulaceae bacterium]
MARRCLPPRWSFNQIWDLVNYVRSLRQETPPTGDPAATQPKANQAASTLESSSQKTES